MNRIYIFFYLFLWSSFYSFLSSLPTSMAISHSRSNFPSCHAIYHSRQWKCDNVMYMEHFAIATFDLTTHSQMTNVSAGWIELRWRMRLKEITAIVRTMAISSLSLQRRRFHVKPTLYKRKRDEKFSAVWQPDKNYLKYSTISNLYDFFLSFSHTNSNAIWCTAPAEWVGNICSVLYRVVKTELFLSRLWMGKKLRRERQYRTTTNGCRHPSEFMGSW